MSGEGIKRIQEGTEKLMPVRSECPSDKRSTFQRSKQRKKLYLGQRKPNNTFIVESGMLESTVIGNNQGQLLVFMPCCTGSTQEPAESSAFVGSVPYILSSGLGRCHPNLPFKQAFRCAGPG